MSKFFIWTVMTFFVLTDPAHILASSFKTELDVNLNHPIRVKSFDIFPHNTYINTYHSKEGEGLPEKHLRKWYWPRNIEQFYSVYPANSKPNVRDEASFIAGIRRRNSEKDYIELIAKANIQYYSKSYDLIKYYEYQDGAITGSGVKVFTSGDADRYVLCHLPPELHLFLRLFWETEAQGYAFLLYKDESIFKNSDRNVADGMSDIRNRCLTESGELDLQSFFLEVERIRRKGNIAERLALKKLMVQPVVANEPIDLTKGQLEMIRYDLRDLDKSHIDTVISLIKNGTVIDAVIELKNYKGFSLGDAKKMVSKWVGDEHFAKEQQSRK